VTDHLPQSVPSKKLLVARILALAGTVGLGVSAFVPMGTGGGEDAVAKALFDPATWESEGLWVLLAAFLFPPILLVFWGLGLFVSRPVRSVFGWIACLACFGILMATALQIWKLVGQEMLNRFSWNEPMAALILAWLVFTAAATLACVSLCAAPARLRLAGCVGAVGVWCAAYFVLLFTGLATMGGMANSGIAVLLFLAGASSVLIAVGGSMETWLLWRRPPADEA
jgi:hypothetical protein